MGELEDFARRGLAAQQAVDEAIARVQTRGAELAADEIILRGVAALYGPADPLSAVVRTVLETAGADLVEKVLNAYLIDHHEVGGPGTETVRRYVHDALSETP